MVAMSVASFSRRRSLRLESSPAAFKTCMIAASFAFMLPVATAPNAIAYSSGLLTLKRMLTVGLGLNIAAAVLIIAFAAAS